jgi:non-ribosomal peptide synthetase component F
MRAPLFAVMFVLQNAPTPATALPGIRIESFGAPLSHAKFDVILTVAETPVGLALQLEYDADRIEPVAAQRLIERFEQVLCRVVRCPDERLSALVDILAEDERALAAAARERYVSALARRLHGGGSRTRSAGEWR